MQIHSYKDLTVWQKSMMLCEKVYKLTDDFPKSEVFGLTSQLRRASVSIPSNIAEGKYRGTRKDFAQFLRIARGSTAELETQINIAKNLGLTRKKIEETVELEKLIEEVSKMLSVLINRLQTPN